MKKNILPPLCFAIILLSSCTQYYYTPNSQNVPLLSKKNEVTGAINYYPVGEGHGIEFQTAYAAGNHVAVQVNFGGGHGSDNSTFPDFINGGNGTTTNAHGSGGYFEGGIGYFLPFDPQKRLVFETYGLLSKGWMNTTYTGTSRPFSNNSISAGMTRIAIQPSIGYKVSHFEMAFSLRAGGVSYSNIKGDLTLDSKSQKDYLNQNKKQFFVEPAVTVKAGIPFVKVQLQFGFSTDETNSKFPYRGGWLSIGLNFNLYAKNKSKFKL